ncbi:MAG: cytochrome C [Desulfobacteraceae bacterium]|nr:MAG: cytochrome C [Desulfobacteraceae bacterium]
MERETGSLQMGMARRLVLPVLLLAIAAFTGGEASAASRDSKVHLTPQVEKVPARPAIFDKQVEPLTMEQCSQCHIGVFNLLKSAGERHQLPCTFCHQQYHTYAPGKLEYQDALPKCTACHGLPHGEDTSVQQCSACHSNAHAPLQIPDVTGEQCSRCHAGPPQALQEAPSKHTQVACTDCHTSHGYIPECAMCHSESGGEPYHLLGVKDSTCLGCHPVHKPLEIKYPADTPQEYCAPCHKNPSHERVLKEVREANSKHNTAVTCATCHVDHGVIPQCSMCHEPHKKDQVNDDCLRCHSNPHQPLNLTYPLEEPQTSCAPCHSEAYDALQQSNTRHTALTCAYCHPTHGELPECQRCHGVPHGEELMKQFGNCGACHGIAHNVQGRMKK